MTDKQTANNVEPQRISNQTAEELSDSDLDQVAGGAGTNGINALIAVTQLKANNANDDALHAADEQRQRLNQSNQLNPRLKL